ncbi:unnamed protein product [Lactuca virosa]|uniref:Mechanosensitive ion channel MscS domain-containing protein n=1 Tax=Lactuca virosa TaxID=75947 RepID=A0AAU9LRI4_9ASTR|nr:unnamed protein product [Lactuca virosa]
MFSLKILTKARSSLQCVEQTSCVERMVWLSYKPYDHLYTYRIPRSCRIISKTSLQIPSHVVPKRNLSICYVAADDDDNTMDLQKTSNPMTEIPENASMETTEAKDPLTSGVVIGFVLLLCTGNMQAVIDLLKNGEGIIPGFFKMIIDHVKGVMLRENFPIGHIIKIDDKDELVGRITEKDIHSTTILGPELRPIKVPNKFFEEKKVENLTMAIGHRIKHNHVFKLADSKKLKAVEDELCKMMRDNHKHVLLAKRSPFCDMEVKGIKVHVSFGCYVKKMEEDELKAMKNQILFNAMDITKKHGLENCAE